MEQLRTNVERLDLLTYEELLMKTEYAARTCYQSEMAGTMEGAERFIESLIKKGHESVIEHINLSYKIQTDRATANQIVRHRLASYSQLSTRYVDHSNLKIVLPSGIDKEMERIILDQVEKIEETYRACKDKGIHKDDLRLILPLCTATKLVMTANMREWRHFLKMRLGKHAHRSIRDVAFLIYKDIYEHYPVFVKDIPVSGE